MRPTPERPWLGWYGHKRWVNRSKYQLKQHPLCCMCLAKGIVNAARVSDHIVRHSGDPMLFWYGKLQSLCVECHSSAKAQIDHKGFVNDIGDDGFPTDENHPFNNI
jgi:5-methylcytosine-specific restriction enzyme A